jgi:hypothetical protein
MKPHQGDFAAGWADAALGDFVFPSGFRPGGAEACAGLSNFIGDAVLAFSDVNVSTGLS